MSGNIKQQKQIRAFLTLALGQEKGEVLFQKQAALPANPQSKSKKPAPRLHTQGGTGLFFCYFAITLRFAPAAGMRCR